MTVSGGPGVHDGGAGGSTWMIPWRSTADMPVETPALMPVQSLSRAPDRGRRPRTSPPGITGRRAALTLGTVGLTCVGGGEVARSLAGDGLSSIDVMLLAAFSALFALLCFGFFNALAGFVLLSARRSLPRRGTQPPRLPSGRTAILLPVHNEDVEPLFARIEAMSRSIAAVGGSALVEMFVLSDSRPERALDEHAAYRQLRRTSAVPLWFRRRPHNEGRKPGNVADWVRRHGGGFDYMLVLDADSLMSGAAVLSLAEAMDRHPRVGLIQTVPGLIGGHTLFARWQQFAARLYGPISTAGLVWWSGAEASFWGHNAIIRTCAFAQACGLPTLDGPGPFGGDIMSHDVVEAALLRRRGWACHLVALPDGTYEEYPPTIVDHARRDRRWCQGNIQHMGMLDTSGLHWVSRFQLVLGVSTYLASPLLLMLLAVSADVALRSDGARQIIAPSGWLLVLTLALLFGPKLMALGWTLADRERRDSFGGLPPLLASVVADLPLATLVAPMVMMTQTMDVIDILRGRRSGWEAQTRATDGIALADAVHRYRPHVLIGMLIAAAAALGWQAAIWMTPISTGLVISPFLEAVTSRVSVGRVTKSLGLFQTPEERSPSALILDAQVTGVDRRATSGGSWRVTWPTWSGAMRGTPERDT